MKKLSVLVILVLVAGMLVMPVLAASSATMTISASKNQVSKGDTFTVSVSASKVEDCATGGFLFDYDQNAFEYVEGSAQVSGFALAGVSTANNKIAGYFMNTTGATTIEGALFKITLKVKATSGTYTISGTSSLSVLNGGTKESVSASVNSITITVGDGQQTETPTEVVTNPTIATEVVATNPAVVTETTEGMNIVAAPTTEQAETPATEQAETPNTQAKPAPIEGALISQDKDNPAAGFPWWIIFALMGIGSIIAIIVIKRK